MFYLLETSVGVALFKKDESMVFVSRYKYGSSSEAVKVSEDMNRGELPEKILDFLSRSLPSSSQLNVQSPDICDALDRALNVTCVSVSDVDFRKIRKNAFKWFDMPKDVFNVMTLRVAYKMVRGAQDDLILVDILNSIEEMDTSINNRIMRIREWYSLHFPELNTVADNLKYLEYLLEIRNRSDFCRSPTSTNIPEDIVYKASNSMGADITSKDVEKIVDNAKSILNDIEYRRERSLLLNSRCKEKFPNLFYLIGESLTAKLIRKAGSISRLSQCPSSTIQIFGSEKAFNEAVKAKSNTPKYGMIFESPLISSVSDENKGKVARVLSNKIALCSKVDAAGDEVSGEYGLMIKKKIEDLIDRLEDKGKTSAKEIKQNKRRIITVKEYDASRDSMKRPKST